MAISSLREKKTETTPFSGTPPPHLGSAPPTQTKKNKQQNKQATTKEPWLQRLLICINDTRMNGE